MHGIHTKTGKVYFENWIAAVDELLISFWYLFTCDSYEATLFSLDAIIIQAKTKSSEKDKQNIWWISTTYTVEMFQIGNDDEN